MPDSSPPIDAGHAALLIMDYQVGILDRFVDADELLGRAERAIALVRERGGTIAYVRVAFTDADLEGLPRISAMGARVAQSDGAFHADSPTTAIHARIAPEGEDIAVRKTRVGAFLTTDLDQQLRGHGVDTLILAGISTSGVLLSTVREAADRDYRILVLSDASADPEPDVHEFLTARIFPKQAEVIVLAELEGRLQAG
jgi:nicotinamidase-related amidase